MSAEPAPKGTPEPRGGGSASVHLMPYRRRPLALRVGWALEGLTPIRRAEILERLPEDAFLQLLEGLGVSDD